MVSNNSLIKIRFKHKQEAIKGNFDKCSFEDEEVIDLLNEKEEKIKQLEKELSQIKETFQFTIAHDYTEYNGDEIHIKDSYTEIHIKKGGLCLKIYPPNTEPYDFYYRVAGTLITHEKFSTKNINPKSKGPCEDYEEK